MKNCRKTFPLFPNYFELIFHVFLYPGKSLVPLGIISSTNEEKIMETTEENSFFRTCSKKQPIEKHSQLNVK